MIPGRAFSDVGVDVDEALSALGRTLHYLLRHAENRVDLLERGISEQRPEGANRS